ncbi:MAG: wax ester/triacylglycerol synthase family O-acyltransferase [Myxococcota bacterium]|nr:wax ester/triacylglycerol synthase family O-acyltransferase [Myxococcota bacterium]
MQQLSGQDAVFLYADTPHCPLQIASLVWLRLPESCRPVLPWFRDYYARTIHEFPSMRQRVVQDPLRIDHPYWADDPHFDLDAHLQGRQLGPDADVHEARALFARFLGERLPADRPLWQGLVVDGIRLPDDPRPATAFMLKLHHAMMDGASGVGLTERIFSETPGEGPPLPAPRPVPAPLPSAAALTWRAARLRAADPLRVARLIATLVSRPRGRSSSAGTARRASARPPALAPRSALNVRISRRRTFDSVEIPAAVLTRLRESSGATVNDLVLTLCGGGLRQYLLGRGQLPGRSLQAFAPMSLHSSDDDGRPTNRISLIRCSLATDIDEPRQRLGRIQAATSRGKGRRSRGERRLVQQLGRMLPAVPMHLAVRAYGLLSPQLGPLTNVVISSIRLSDDPLYMGPGSVVGFEGSGPLLDGLGLLIMAFGYRGGLTLSLTAAPEAVPDLPRLVEALGQQPARLEASLAGPGPALRQH